MLVALSLASAALAAPSAGVAILHATAWSPGDNARSGAGEFEVMLQVARLRRGHGAAGLVSVGDRNGSRLGGGELALRYAALTGVPVAKIAPGGTVAADPEALFLDGGTLDADRAAAVLARCLALHGPPPAAANPEQPTSHELAAIRTHLRKYQAALALESTQRLASR